MYKMLSHAFSQMTLTGIGEVLWRPHVVPSMGHKVRHPCFWSMLFLQGRYSEGEWSRPIHPPAEGRTGGSMAPRAVRLPGRVCQLTLPLEAGAGWGALGI